VALAALLTLCGCGGGASIGKLPESFGGLPESAPARPAETMPYPNVYEPRPSREAKPLTAEEQKRLESELSNLRDAQNKRANPPPAREPKPGAKARTASKAPAKEPAKEGLKEALKEQPKEAPKERPKKKVAEKPKPKPPEKKPADTLVPEPKTPSDLKLMN